MSTVIQIKRSSSGLAPNTSILAEAELAYSQDQAGDGANAILYIESINSSASPVIHKIGGKYYTDIVDTATSSATGDKLVKRDSAGSFAANVVTANEFIGNVYGTVLIGEASSAVIANTANALTTGRYIVLGGDVVGSAYFDGTGNAEINATVIQANSVALGEDTTGDYVANLTAGTGISLSGQTGETANITVGLTNTGVAAATYGSTTNIPVLAVDAQGRITSAANATISTDLSIAGDSGTDTVSLLNETLHFAGVDLISTSASGNTITITNNGVKRVSSGGYGLDVSAATGNITVTNTGVTRLETSGSGVFVNGNNGNITITNTGVTGITGTANEVEVTAATGNITIGLPQDVTIARDLSVLGNLNILGNVTQVGTVDLRVDDPLIYLAGNNYSSDLVDIGFIGNYFDGTNQRHAGLFRDASDSGKFKLFANLIPEPDTGVIDTGNASFTIATLVTNITGGTVSGLTANIAVADGGTGRGALTTNAVLFGQGTSQVGLASGSAYQVLQLNGSGVPVFAGLDGGTY